MLFKQWYRYCETKRLHHKQANKQALSVETPRTDSSVSARSGGYHYIELAHLQKITDELDDLTQHINELRQSIALLQETESAEPLREYQERLVRAFTGMRDDLNQQALNQPYGSAMTLSTPSL